MKKSIIAVIVSGALALSGCIEIPEQSDSPKQNEVPQMEKKEQGIQIKLPEPKKEQVILENKFSEVQDTINQFRDHYAKRFEGVPMQEYANGVYAIDESQRANWQAIEDGIPQYEIAIEQGEELWDTPFKNGQTYESCLGSPEGLQAKYPHYDEDQKKVMTLNLAINQCREKNGEEPLKYNKGKIAQLGAYIGYESRGIKTDVKVESDGAYSAWKKGKDMYFERRGQLNFACSHCHYDNAGKRIRSETLSMSTGHTTGWPSYRAKWSEIGTLHRRFKGCNKNVRAAPYNPQSEEYRNLEYFLTTLSNGLELNAPASRK